MGNGRMGGQKQETNFLRIYNLLMLNLNKLTFTYVRFACNALIKINLREKISEMRSQNLTKI